MKNHFIPMFYKLHLETSRYISQVSHSYQHAITPRNTFFQTSPHIFSFLKNPHDPHHLLRLHWSPAHEFGKNNYTVISIQVILALIKWTCWAISCSFVDCPLPDKDRNPFSVNAAKWKAKMHFRCKWCFTCIFYHSCATICHGKLSLVAQTCLFMCFLPCFTIILQSQYSKWIQTSLYHLIIQLKMLNTTVVYWQFQSKLMCSQIINTILTWLECITHKREWWS